MGSRTEYYKHYKRGYRKVKKNAKAKNGGNMISDNYYVSFSSKSISTQKFKESFSDKIKSANQENMLNCLIDMMELIQTAKSCLEEQGAYTVMETGQIKVNPAQKELRENIKTFNNIFEIFISTFEEETIDLNKWLE